MHLPSLTGLNFEGVVPMEKMLELSNTVFCHIEAPRHTSGRPMTQRSPVDGKKRGQRCQRLKLWNPHAHASMFLGTVPGDDGLCVITSRRHDVFANKDQIQTEFPKHIIVAGNKSLPRPLLLFGDFGHCLHP